MNFFCMDILTFQNVLKTNFSGSQNTNLVIASYIKGKGVLIMPTPLQFWSRLVS
jgi:hypothetical protein